MLTALGSKEAEMRITGCDLHASQKTAEVFHDLIGGQEPRFVAVHISNVFGQVKRCPFLALSVQQSGANSRKRRHKAKVGKRRILGAMMGDPATPSTPRHRAATVVWFAC
jgi:hypothetical protein